MRSFWRSLKFSLVYRTRLILSVFCALMVAVFWGANISSVGAVLTILADNKTLQQWVDEKIEHLDANAKKKEKERIIIQERLTAVEDDPNAVDRENVKRGLNKKLAEVLGDQKDINRKLYWTQLLKMQVIRFLPNDQFQTFVWIMVAVVIGVAVKGVFDFGQEVLVGGVINRTLYDIRNRMFRSLVHQDFRQIAEAGTPEIMSRLTNDVEQLGQGIKTLYGRLVVEPLKAIACLIAACLISWQLTVVFVVLVPVALIMLTKLSRMMRRAAKKLLEQMSDLYQIIRESFDGIRVVKAFTMEPYERRRFRRAADQYARRAQQVSNIDAFSGPMIEWLGIVALGLALTAGAYLVITQERRIAGLNMRGDDPLGFTELLTLYTLLIAVADPVRKLSSVYTKIQAGAAAADRIFVLADKMPTITTNSDSPVLPRHAKTIEFRNITFAYTHGTETPTLNGVNLTVKAGETIAIVGPNGCGKSTLLGFLPRFYDPDIGTVLIDGVNSRTVNLRSLRKQVGLVTQNTVLFEDTIFNNIAYGKIGATKEEVEAAAKKAFAEEFIEVLPGGYNTVIGKTWKPSGGQEQRLALARAILRNPSILILDEFTSQIDPESEAKIHLAIREFVKGRTTFLITHRMSNVEFADRIVVMDAGRIVAVGSHASLTASCPLYQRLYDAQTPLRSEAA
ncbi:ABC transporter ATP-binding protein [Limnoglobus roseus]|uniref:ABC transporter ATP-binding protein n=1 Tax=Limnoglobus roseus TaxID=2598579 RepID=A0A5C1ANM4_9BACT|nr:ABC transporter ATP-binding protein [Limnoglobus roseus]QEL18458.1 ABC transporter ATP-binding protein [Limnoglobus roseus]